MKGNDGDRTDLNCNLLVSSHHSFTLLHSCALPRTVPLPQHSSVTHYFFDNSCAPLIGIYAQFEMVN